MKRLAILFPALILASVVVAQDEGGAPPADESSSERKEREAREKLEREQARIDRRRELRESFDSSERLVAEAVESFALEPIRDWEDGFAAVLSEPPRALVKPLRYYLIDDDWEVVAFACESTGRAGLVELLPELTAAYGEARYAIIRRKAVGAAARMAADRSAQEASDLLALGLADEEPGVRLLAVEGFEALGDVDALATATEDPDPDTRYAALGALARLGHAGARVALLEGFRSYVASRDLQRRASLETHDVGERYAQFLNALALGHWGGEAAVDLLGRALLLEGDYGNKLFLAIGSAAALGMARPPDERVRARRMDLLERALRANDANVRAMAAFAAGYAAEPELLRPLRRLLNDAQIDVRHNAVEAIGRTPGRQPVELLEDVVRKENEVGVRLAAVRALSRHEEPEAVEVLERALRDKRYMVRVAAARMLGRKGPAAASAARSLVKAARDPDYGVREAAIVALARVGVPEGVEPIGDALKDRDDLVRIRALRALARHPAAAVVRESEEIAERAVELLCGASEIEQRRAARELLTRVRSPHSVEPLIDELESDTYARRSAALTVLRDFNRGRALDYNPSGSPAERREAAGRWEDWWEGGGSIAPLPPPPKRRANLDLPVFHRYARDLRWQGIDLVLAYDSTGSMIPVIRAVKQRLDLLIEESARIVPNLRLSLFTYRDVGEEYVYYGTPLTYATHNLKAFVQVAEANRGGDLPEAITTTVTAAIERLRWRPDAQKVIVVIGDAPYHPEREDELFARVREFARPGNKGVVHALFTDPNRLGESIGARRTRTTSGVTFPFLDRLEELAKVGGGRAVTIEDTDMLIEEILVLSFGEKWRSELEKRLDFE